MNEDNEDNDVEVVEENTNKDEDDKDGNSMSENTNEDSATHEIASEDGHMGNKASKDSTTGKNTSKDSHTGNHASEGNQSGHNASKDSCTGDNTGMVESDNREQGNVRYPPLTPSSPANGLVLVPQQEICPVSSYLNI